MNHITRCLLAGGLLSAASFILSAQQPGPPKVLRIFREDIKEGKVSAHEKVEARFAQMLAKHKYPANSVGMTSLTGASQAWFLEGHESFASIGEAEAFFGKPAIKPEIDTLDAQDSELRSGSRSWIAAFRNDLSFRTGEMMESIAKARYFNVVIFRIHQGRDQEFADLAKTAVAASQKAGNNQSVVVYQVVSGGSGGIYLLFEPSASLKSLDEAPARSQAMYSAMGTQGSKRFNELASATISSEESLLFTINPKMSYVSKEFAAGDPDFWTPKVAKPAKK
ncbi:MAG TPA: hypothetical protein VIX89_04965 [Bryobacteraceae bacterium]